MKTPPMSPVIPAALLLTTLLAFPLVFFPGTAVDLSVK